MPTGATAGSPFKYIWTHFEPVTDVFQPSGYGSVKNVFIVFLIAVPVVDKRFLQPASLAVFAEYFVWLIYALKKTRSTERQKIRSNLNRS